MKDLLRLIKLFRPYAVWMAFGIVLSLVSTLASMTLMAVSGWFIAAMGLAGVAAVTMNYFTPASIIRACAITRTGGRYAERLVTHEATFRLISSLRVWFYKRLEPLAPAFTSQSRSGDLMSNLHGDIDTLERFYLGFLVPVVTISLTIIIVIAAFAYYNLALACIIGVFIISAALIIPFAVYKKSQKYEEAIITQDSMMRTDLSENLQGMGELLIYDRKENYKRHFEEINISYALNQNKLGLIASLSQNSIGLLSGLSLLCVILMTAPLAQQQVISYPDIALLALLSMATFESISITSQAFQGLGGVQRAAQRIFAIADQDLLIKNPQEPHKLPSKFDLEFQNVSFAYKKESDAILQDVSFTLKAGEKMAVIGSTGSGKSSLVNLMLRFWDADKGHITIGGEDISKFNLEDLRNQFAVLPQRPHIFTSTLKDNLKLANPEATQKQIEDACIKAGLHDHIEALPHGYNTFVGENGNTLSGGQIKRLALARALLKKAPCLILDEPGEGLDYTMEQDILNRVIETLEDRSLILITHRPAGLSAMDKIIHLENGRIMKR